MVNKKKTRSSPKTTDWDNTIVWVGPEQDTTEIRKKIWNEWGRPKIEKENRGVIRAEGGRTVYFHRIGTIIEMHGLDPDTCIMSLDEMGVVTKLHGLDPNTCIMSLDEMGVVTKLHGVDPNSHVVTLDKCS
jgi:hypothetical protein